MKNLGEKVKIKLIKLGMTQKDLAFLMGTTRQNLNNVLRGRNKSLPLEERLEVWLREYNNTEDNPSSDR